jgi:hypothetical protein
MGGLDPPIQESKAILILDGRVEPGHGEIHLIEFTL